MAQLLMYHANGERSEGRKKSVNRRFWGENLRDMERVQNKATSTHRQEPLVSFAYLGSGGRRTYATDKEHI